MLLLCFASCFVQFSHAMENQDARSEVTDIKEPFASVIEVQSKKMKRFAAHLNTLANERAKLERVIVQLSRVSNYSEGQKKRKIEVIDRKITDIKETLDIINTSYQFIQEH